MATPTYEAKVVNGGDVIVRSYPFLPTGRGVIVALAERISALRPHDKSYWKRLVRLSATCGQNLKMALRFPPVSQQVTNSVVKNYKFGAIPNTDNSSFFNRDKSVDEDTISEQVKLNILGNRCTAAVVYSEASCRFAENVPCFEVGEMIGSHCEVLFVLEVTKGAAAGLLENVINYLLTEQKTPKVIVEVPSYWSPYFKNATERMLLKVGSGVDLKSTTGMKYFEIAGDLPAPTEAPVLQDDMKYPDDEDFTATETNGSMVNVTKPETLPPVLIDGEYLTSAEGNSESAAKQRAQEEAEQFQADYLMITQYPESAGPLTSIANIEAIQGAHDHMLAYAMRTSDASNLLKVVAVEKKMKLLGADAGNSIAQYIDSQNSESAASLSLEQIANLRTLAASLGHTSSQIAFERRRLVAAPNAAERAASLAFIWRNANRAEDLADLQLDNLDSATALHSRMVELRTNWQKQRSTLAASLLPSFKALAADTSNTNLIAEVNKNQASLNALDEVANAMEHAFENKMHSLLQRSHASQRGLISIKMSEWTRERTAATLWSSDGTAAANPGTSAAQTTNALLLSRSVPGSVTVAPPADVAPTPEKMRTILGDIQKQLANLRKEEAKQLEKARTEMRDLFTRMVDKNSMIRTHAETLNQMQMLDNTHERQLKAAADCYQSGYLAAVRGGIEKVIDATTSTASSTTSTSSSSGASVVVPDLELKDMKAVVEIVRNSNECLASFLEVFQLAVKRASENQVAVKQAQLLQRQERIRSENFNIINAAVSESQKMLKQPRVFAMDAYGPRITAMEQMQKKAKDIVNSLTVDSSVLDFEKAQKEVREITTALTKSRLELEELVKNPQLTQDYATWQALKQSQDDLATVMKKAKDSAKAAEGYRQQALQAQKQSEAIASRVDFARTPLRKLSLSRTSLQSALELSKQRNDLVLRSLIESLNHFCRNGSVEEIQAAMRNLSTEAQNMSREESYAAIAPEVTRAFNAAQQKLDQLQNMNLIRPPPPPVPSAPSSTSSSIDRYTTASTSRSPSRERSRGRAVSVERSALAGKHARLLKPITNNYYNRRSPQTQTNWGDSDDDSDY